MKELIKIGKEQIGTETINSVNSRELYEYLGLGKGHYTRWVQTNLLDLFIENEDFKGVRHNVEGNEVITYIVTLDVAKHLCMMAKTNKAMEVRKYFIEVEKQASKPKTLSLEDLLKENTKMISNLQNRVISLKCENKTLEITNNMLMHTNKLYTATEIAKELGFSSATILNKKLEELKIQYKTNDCWVLSFKYSNLGYTSIKQYILENGKVVYDRKFTQKGREFLLKLFQEQEDIKQQESYIIKNNDILYQEMVYEYKFQAFI